MSKHYGHVGPAFIEWLALNLNEFREQWAQVYAALCAEFPDRAGTSSVAGRMATYFAAVELAARRVHESFDLPWTNQAVVMKLYDRLTSEVEDAEGAATAMAHVAAFFTANVRDFISNSQNPSQLQPHGGWRGIVLERRSTSQSCIGFFSAELHRVLCDGGFQPQSIIRQWRDLKWIVTDKGRTAKSIKFNGKNERFIMIDERVMNRINLPPATTINTPAAAAK